jgi:hypothetical protein
MRTPAAEMLSFEKNGGTVSLLATLARKSPRSAEIPRACPA